MKTEFSDMLVKSFLNRKCDGVFQRYNALSNRVEIEMSSIDLICAHDHHKSTKGECMSKTFSRILILFFLII